MENFILFGTVIKTHGLNGDFVLHCDFENPKQFTGNFYTEEQGAMITFPAQIVALLNGEKVIMKCDNINSIDTARNVIRKQIFIKRDDLDNLNSNEYYACDLIGLTVKSAKDNTTIGIVNDVVDFGSGVNLEVKNSQEKLEYYVFDDSVVVDLQSNIVKISLPEYV